MPFAIHEGARLYFRLDGDAAKPPLLLLNSIGTDLASWDRALPHLLGAFRILRMDTRGHGASDATPGDYSLDLLAADAFAVMDAAGVAKAMVCGVSLGAMTALAMALKAPERLDGLVAACTSTRMDAQVWRDRIATVHSKGVSAIAEAALSRFVSEPFARRHPEVVDTLRANLVSMSSEGYAGCAAAIRDMELTQRLGEIGVATLVIGGERDVSTPFDAHGCHLAEAIPGACAAILDAGHLAQVEAPAAFAAELIGFQRARRDGGRATDAATVLYEQGLLNRRRVLGDSWVDRSLAGRTPFNTDFQAMITRIAWQEVWGRPGLDDRTRRLLVLAITASLGRWEEFRLHVRAGLQQGGFTEAELKETLMQTAIYAGVPAANTAFAEAAAVMTES